jgi:hypothetical protein
MSTASYENDRVVMNCELGRAWEDVFGAYFKVHSCRCWEKSWENCLDGRSFGRYLSRVRTMDAGILDPGTRWR